MPAGQIIKLGWDRPLDIDWDFHLADLRRSIRDRAPGGHTGALKSAFDSPDTAVINEGKDVITIEVGRRHRAWAYAAIQEHGGPQFTRIIRPVRAKALRFYWLGKLRFFSKITMRAGQIVGLHYVENGVWDWWYKLKRGLLGNVPVWRSKHYAQPMQTRGRIS